MDIPLGFTPLLKVRVWGGEVLKTRHHHPPAEPVGESWELADHGDDTTVALGGPHDGQSLHDLFVQNRDGLCGEAIDPASPDAFPLLLKLIDAQQDLSVQVHPGDDYAGRQKAGELGKTEAWYVLGADPGARIYRGLKEGVTKDRFAEALRDGTVADLLHSFPAKAGDVVHLPSGTIHALGAGVRIAEIQQNSDTTYRVFDWNRVGLDGQPRELHVDHALAVADVEAGGPDTQPPVDLGTGGCRHERLVDCDKFRFERLRNFEGRPVPLSTEGKAFHILTVVEGDIVVKTKGGSLRRDLWDTCLVPAGAGEYSISPSLDALVLLFYRPVE